MRDNFRPNVRLTTNILLVIGTFCISLNLAPIAKRAKLENLCKELQYTYYRGSRAKSFYEDNQKTINWYYNRRKILNRQIIKLAGMKSVKDTRYLYSARICDYQFRETWSP